MERDRYLELLAVNGARLRVTAARDLDAPVPSCPGWTVRDAVQHTAEVYEHKIAAIALGGPAPEPWPPAWPADHDPLSWLEDAHERLLEVLRSTDPAAGSWTWLPEDQTAGFWVRRMAQETAVHRVDVELALGCVTPIDVELAVDGIDEVLDLMLGGDWGDDPQAALTGRVSVATEGKTWTIAMSADRVDIERRASLEPVDATVTAEPSALLLWMYGRAGNHQVHVEGAADAAGRLRQRLALAT